MQEKTQQQEHKAQQEMQTELPLTTEKNPAQGIPGA